VETEKQILRHKYRGKVAPKSILAFIRAFEIRYDCPSAFEATAEKAAVRIESWAYWFAREFSQIADPLRSGVDGAKVDGTLNARGKN
jgi:hypothetical protein